MARYPYDAEQLMAQSVEQLKYKFRLFKQVLQDFERLLEDAPSGSHIKDVTTKLTNKINPILTSRRILPAYQTRSVYTDWKALAYLVNTTNSTAVPREISNRMKNLMKCSELGFAAYKNCQQNPTKLAAFSAQVDKFQGELKKWQEYEQSVYVVVIPVLREIEKILVNGWAKKFDSLILPVLPKLADVHVQMQRHPFYSNDLNRVIEDTKQFNRMTTNLLHLNQVFADRVELNGAIEQIQRIDPKIPAKIEAVNGIITANLMLDMCRTSNEVLKLHVFPFDQDYLELCNIPAIADPTKAKEHVKQHLLRNIETLKDKILYNSAILRPQDAVTFNPHMDPYTFHEWKFNNYKNEIKRLLGGEKIILSTDAAKNYENAFKFNQLLLDFMFANKTRQNEFYQALMGFTVNLKMVGNHQFRCDKRVYYVPSDASLFLQYRVGQNNTVAASNSLHQELAKRKPAYLSVLSTWELQLVHNSLGEQQKLQRFAGDEIDLQFKGGFRFVMNRGLGQEVCSNYALNKNYQIDRYLN